MNYSFFLYSTHFALVRLINKTAARLWNPVKWEPFALFLVMPFLHYNKCETSEAVFHRIEQLTSEALLEVANEMFAEDYLSTLIYR